MSPRRREIQDTHLDGAVAHPFGAFLLSAREGAEDHRLRTGSEAAETKPEVGGGADIADKKEAGGVHMLSVLVSGVFGCPKVC